MIPGGLYDGTDLADKVFYGLRLNHATGDLTVEVIDDGSELIVLPQDDVVDPNAYKITLWSRDTLDFRIDARGHLQLTIV